MQLTRTTFQKVKIILSYDVLYKLIWDDNLTYTEIRDLYKINKRQVSKLAKHYNIPLNQMAISAKKNNSRRVIIEKEKLLDLYSTQNLSARQIAKLYNCTHSSVLKNLREHGIKIRESSFISYYDNRRKFNSTPFVDSNGYIHIQKNREHRLQMELILGRKLNPKEHVHHIDFNKRNNSIENLFVFENFSIHLLYHGFLNAKKQYISPQKFLIYYEDNIKPKLCNYDWLFQEYIVKGKSCNQLSKEIDVSKLAVTIRLKSYGIYYLRKPTVNQFD